jgi:hypothetical protein
MKRNLAALLLASLLAASALAESEQGQIWVWTTPDGAIHYTDDRERVPDAYRDAARVAHEEGGGSYQRMPAAPAGRAPAATQSTAAEAIDPEAAAEAAWRDQARAIDGRIAALAPQVEACKTDHVNRSPGDGSRKRREEREEAERCARARQDLADARAERDALDERAHRAGIPPGWVRTDD